MSFPFVLQLKVEDPSGLNFIVGACPSGVMKKIPKYSSDLVEFLAFTRKNFLSS